MGYTHYWTFHKNHTKVSPIMIDDLKKVLEKYSDILCYEYDRPFFAPELDEKHIRFNGKGEDGHETFHVDFFGKGAYFCKTAYKLYDIAVCECLLIIKAHMFMELSSDGFYNHKLGLDGKWDEAISNVNKMGYDIHYKMKRQENPIYTELDYLHIEKKYTTEDMKCPNCDSDKISYIGTGAYGCHTCCHVWGCFTPDIK